MSDGESVTDDVERSLARSLSEGKLSVSMRFSNIQNKSEPSSLGEFPHFLRELQADKNILIACYNALGRLDFLSDGVYQTMGYDVNTPVEDITFPMASCRGSIFYRQHEDGSLVKFHNTFKSKLRTGEQFTMDEIMPPSEEAPLTLLVNPTTSVVTHHHGGIHFKSLRIENEILGKSICEMASPDSANNIMESLLKASQGSCSFNVTTQLLNTTVRVSMDFFPCSNGHSVVLVTPLALEYNDSKGGISSLLCNMNSTEAGDERLRPSFSPSALEGFSMERRLSDLNNEIKYLRDFRDNVNQPMFSISSEGRVIWANTAMLTLMGFANSPNKFVDSMVIAYHADPMLMATMISMLLDGQRLVNFPCNLRHRNGTILNATFNSNAKFDSDGNFLYSRCVVLDMTEQNKLRMS
jgi:PAS domain-containing protein